MAVRSTTMHLAFAVLVNHFYQGARAFTPLSLVSLALSGAPWLFPTGWGVLGSVLAQLVWVGVWTESFRLLLNC